MSTWTREEWVKRRDELQQTYSDLSQIVACLKTVRDLANRINPDLTLESPIDNLRTYLFSYVTLEDLEKARECTWSDYEDHIRDEPKPQEPTP